jgi:hypothetical protein
MSPENYRVLRTVILILCLMAFATVVLTLALFTFSRPAKGEVIDARKVFVIDGDTFALGGERIRLLGVDAPEPERLVASRSASPATARSPGWWSSCASAALSTSAAKARIRSAGPSRTSSSMAEISATSSCARSWRYPTDQAQRRKQCAWLTGAARPTERCCCCEREAGECPEPPTT